MSLVSQAKALIKVREQNAPPPRLPDNIRELTGFEPRPLQEDLTAAMRRLNSFVMHRRFGKSVWAVNTLIEAAVACPFPRGRYAYLGPTYSQVEDIAWTYLKEYTENIPGRVVSESRLAVTLPTYGGDWARIRLYGVDSPKQRLRGMYLDGLVVDEWSEIPQSVWTEQARPMLSDDVRSGYDDFLRQNQWAVFIFTPKGRNHAYRMHTKAEMWEEGLPVEEEDPETGVTEQVFRNDWSARLFRSSETGIIPRNELRDALADMGQSRFDQEFECSFDAAIEGAIFAKELADLRARKRVVPIGYNPNLPVHTGWDLGWDDATAIWFAQPIGGEIRLIDYYETNRTDLPTIAKVLADKGYKYGKHYLPHDVEVHDLGAGKKRRDILSENGVRVTTIPRVKVKDDAIQAARSLLPRCWFDKTTCMDGLDRLALYHREYDEKNGVFREKPAHDWASHAADAFMGLAMGLRKFRTNSDGDPNNMTTGVF